MKNKMVRKVSLLALVAVIVMVTGGAVLYVGASDFNVEPTYVVAEEVEAGCCPAELVEEVAPLGDSINAGGLRCNICLPNVFGFWPGCNSGVEFTVCGSIHAGFRCNC